MSIFSDDFERPDGGIGNNWTAAGTVAIASGKATFATSASIRHTDIAGTGRQEAIATVVYAVAGDMNAGPIIKATMANSSGYSAGAGGTLASPSWRIYRIGTGGGTTNLATVGGPAISVGSHTLRLLYADGMVSLWVDGYLIARVLDNTYDSQSKGGWAAWTGGALLDAITFYGDETTSFTVTPTVVGNYNNTTAMTLTGVGTSWGTGTPGTPTFTVDHGALSSQEVTGAGAATVVYTPGNFLGTATFLDPSTGATDTVEVTSDIITVPPEGVGDTWSPYKTLVDATGTLFEPDYLLTDRSPVIPSSEQVPGQLDILVAIQHIYTHTVGEWVGTEPEHAALLENLMVVLTGDSWPTITTYEPTRNTSLKEELEWIRDYIDGLRGDNEQTLGGVIDAIQGAPLQTLDSLSDQIAGISAGSNQDVLDALSAYFGANPPTIRQLGDMLSDIATIAGYTLGDVLDEIGAVQTSLSSVGSTVSTISTNVTNGFQAVLDAIEAIQPGQAGPAGPLWPGEANVTYGTPVTLADRLTITTPMDGVIVEYTTPPYRTSHYILGSKDLYYGSGRIAFEDDAGHVEFWQYLGFASALYVPHAMQRASAVHIQLIGGAEGTVTPWVVSEA